MGFKYSLYLVVKQLSIAKEFAIEDLLDPKNPFYWDRVVLNLPYSDSFDPSMPCYHKLNSSIGKITSNLITFVDDMRITDFSVENC